jgi:uncharacterized RDD family membrane protein YckC
MRTIELTSNVVPEPQIMAVQPLSSASLWQISMMVAITISGLLLVFLVRPASGQTSVALATNVVPLPLGARMTALLIDLVPAGVLATLLLRTSISDLFAVPVFTINFEQGSPYLLMAGITVLHSSIAELVSGKSLGKAMVGARITRLDGSRARAGQLLMRNGLKCLVLLVPPLAVLAIFSPHLQGLADLAAGTVVVHEDSEQSDSKHKVND